MAKRKRPVLADRPYRSIRDWLTRTGTTTTGLHNKLLWAGVDISRAHLDNILKGRYKPSLWLALDIESITGVPVEKLAQWVKPQRRKQLRAQLEHPNWKDIGIA